MTTTTTELPKRTTLGYRTFRCSTCRRRFNERTGTPYNYLGFPTDIVLLVVLWRVRYKLSLRDLAEMFLERGLAFTHEAVREWEARFAPLLTDKLRAKRTGQAGCSWHVDETYIRVAGKWKYLYRAIDRDGNLVDSLLSDHRDMDAAKRFFTAALDVAGEAPERVTTDGLTPTHGRSAKRWARPSPIAATRTSTTESSRIIVASNSATIRCVGSGMLTRLVAFAAPSTNSGTISAYGRQCASVFHH
jgi:transposase-like protein